MYDADDSIKEIEYFWGPDLSGRMFGAGGIGGLVAISMNGDFYLPMYDNYGNVIAYLNEQGSPVAQYQYDAFGNIDESAGDFAEIFAMRFSTKYFDFEIDLVYYGYRFYNPSYGRWLTRDPIDEDGGLNLYLSCGNNLIQSYDSLGCQWKIKRDSSQRWATVIPTDDSDTLETLARLIHLDYNERGKWIKGGSSLSERAHTCYKYSIPNVMGFYISKTFIK